MDGITPAEEALQKETSQVSCVHRPPATPHTPVVTANAPGSLRVSWNHNLRSTHYKIIRYDADGKKKETVAKVARLSGEVIELGGEACCFYVDTGLTEGIIYRYAIQAILRIGDDDVAKSLISEQGRGKVRGEVDTELTVLALPESQIIAINKTITSVFPGHSFKFVFEFPKETPEELELPYKIKGAGTNPTTADNYLSPLTGNIVIPKGKKSFDFSIPTKRGSRSNVGEAVLTIQSQTSDYVFSGFPVGTASVEFDLFISPKQIREGINNKRSILLNPSGKKVFSNGRNKFTIRFLLSRAHEGSDVTLPFQLSGTLKRSAYALSQNSAVTISAGAKEIELELELLKWEDYAKYLGKSIKLAFTPPASYSLPVSNLEFIMTVLDDTRPVVGTCDNGESLVYWPETDPEPIVDTTTGEVIHVLQEQKAFLPYLMLQPSLRPDIVADYSTGCYPFTYIARVKARGSHTDDVLNYKIKSVEPSEYRDLFAIDQKSGIVYIPYGQKTIDIFERNDELIWETQGRVEPSRALFYFAGVKDHFPEKLTLNIEVSNQDSAKKDMRMVVEQPMYGKADCDDMDWSEGLDSSWTPEKVKAIQKAICEEYRYPIYPRSTSFKTTQEYRDSLPLGLTQNKENYELVFQDEFNRTGSEEQLNPRIWYTAKEDCHRVKLRDGSLQLGLTKACAGSNYQMLTRGRFEFLYGYLEAKFLELPTVGDYPNSRFHLSSYERGAGYHYPPGVRDYVCYPRPAEGATNLSAKPIAKRKRLLHTHGVEMQFPEMENFSGGSDYAWFIFYTNGRWLKNCHRYPTELGRSAGITSSIYLENFEFPTRKADWGRVLTSDSTTPPPSHKHLDNNGHFTFGMEWTPAGYKFFINGKPYEGFKSLPGNEYLEGGYSTRANIQLYNFNRVAFNPSELIRRTVSHSYQYITFTLGYPGLVDTAISNNTEVLFVKVDYIRVYQPKDRYAFVTKEYR